jgi:Protein of unknown function (DUF3383)
MNTGLSVNDVVNVGVLLTPPAAQERNFGNLLILGDSEVIDTTQRQRLYTSLGQVGGDFSTTAPEYLAAALFFDQSPQPAQCYIGRWASSASSGLLLGGPLSTADQTLSNFTSITNGGISITIDGTPYNLTGLNFSAQTNLNGIASVIQTALGGAGTITWNPISANFQVRSGTTGTASAVTFATPGAGTDISDLTGLDAPSGGSISVGIAAETILAAVAIHDNMTSQWYGLKIASTITTSTNDKLGVSSYIEGTNNSHIVGYNSLDPAMLDPTSTTDLASVMQAAGFNRTFVMYSNTPHAAASVFGRAFTVDFDGTKTTITLKFQDEPGVTPETLTETQAQALNGKNCNVFVRYNNAISILQQGTMASGQFFDTVHGTDWLQNAIQTAIFNALYTSKTKIPQTDAGVNVLIAALSSELDQSVENGLVAPGVWNGPPVGAIVTGQSLSKGYYIYAPPIATQSAAARAARQSPVISAAIKLAGAIHSVDVILSVNS